MNVKLTKDFKIEIDIFCLIETATDEAKRELAKQLACDDEIIQMVYDQLISGCTEDGRCGSSYATQSNSKKGSLLDRLQRRIAKESSETAKQEIEILECALKIKEDQAKKYQNDYYKLYHWINENNIKTPRGLL